LRECFGVVSRGRRSRDDDDGDERFGADSRGRRRKATTTTTTTTTNGLALLPAGGDGRLLQTSFAPSCFELY
jgi:hypothetical protein